MQPGYILPDLSFLPSPHHQEGNLHGSLRMTRAGIAQSLSSGWTDEGSQFEYRYRASLLFSPRRPDMLWDPLSLVSNGYRGFFPGGKAAEA